MTIAATMSAAPGAESGPATGLKLGPEAGKSGLDDLHAPALESLAGTSFRSSWQSTVASLGQELNADEAQKPADASSGAAPLPVKTGQPPVQSLTGADAAQAAIARFKLGLTFLLDREANAAPQAETHGQDLETSAIPAKSIHYEDDAHNSGEKKACKNAADAFTTSLAAAFAPVAIALPAPEAVHRSPQPQRTTVGGHGQSSLRELPSAGERPGAALLTGGVAPAVPGENTDGILTAAGSGISPGGRAANAGSAANADDGAQGGAGHRDASIVSANAFSENTSASGAVQPVQATAGNADAGGADSIADAAGSITSSHMAHAPAAGERRGAEPASAQRLTPAAASSTSLQGHMAGVQAGAQPIGATSDPSAFARDGAAGRAVPATLPAAPASKAPGAGETFTALDTDAAHGASWLHAGTHSAEAGFEDPALGWVSVRADLAAGGVQAAVVPGTAEAAQALSPHMAGLNSYLNDQRSPVHTLTLSAPGGDSLAHQQAGNQGAGNQEAPGQSGGESPAYRGAAGQQTAPPVPAAAQTGTSAAPTAGDAIPFVPRAGASISLFA